jgi:hypothetical protein
MILCLGRESVTSSLARQYDSHVGTPTLQFGEPAGQVDANSLTVFGHPSGRWRQVTSPATGWGGASSPWSPLQPSGAITGCPDFAILGPHRAPWRCHSGGGGGRARPGALVGEVWIGLAGKRQLALGPHRPRGELSDFRQMNRSGAGYRRESSRPTPPVRRPAPKPTKSRHSRPAKATCSWPRQLCGIDRRTSSAIATLAWGDRRFAEAVAATLRSAAVSTAENFSRRSGGGFCRRSRYSCSSRLT